MVLLKLIDFFDDFIDDHDEWLMNAYQGETGYFPRIWQIKSNFYSIQHFELKKKKKMIYVILKLFFKIFIHIGSVFFSFLLCFFETQ